MIQWSPRHAFIEDEWLSLKCQSWALNVSRCWRAKALKCIISRLSRPSCFLHLAVSCSFFSMISLSLNGVIREVVFVALQRRFVELFSPLVSSPERGGLSRESAQIFSQVGRGFTDRLLMMSGKALEMTVFWKKNINRFSWMFTIESSKTTCFKIV